MTDSTVPTSRPVSLVTILFILALSASFLFLVMHYYQPSPAAAQNQVPENLAKDLEWKATPTSRKAKLADLRAAEQKQATTYGWVDQPNGPIRLPLDQAMKLTVEKYGGNK